MKVAQSSLTLWDAMDSTVHGILQAGTLEGVAVPFSRASSQPRSPTLQVGSLLAELLGKPFPHTLNTSFAYRQNRVLEVVIWDFRGEKGNSHKAVKQMFGKQIFAGPCRHHGSVEWTLISRPCRDSPLHFTFTFIDNSGDSSMPGPLSKKTF